MKRNGKKDMETYFEMMKLLRSARKIEELDAHREELARLFPQIRTMFDLWREMEQEVCGG